MENSLYFKNVYDYNKKLLTKIEQKKFTNQDFNNFTNKGLKIESTEINSINDETIFDLNSIKLLYTIPKNNYTLTSDKNNNIYVVKIKNVDEEKLVKESDNFNNYLKITNSNIRNNLYSSYDQFLNSKYKIKVYRNTLDRIKNYFR